MRKVENLVYAIIKNRVNVDNAMNNKLIQNIEDFGLNKFNYDLKLNEFLLAIPRHAAKTNLDKVPKEVAYIEGDLIGHYIEDDE